MSFWGHWHKPKNLSVSITGLMSHRSLERIAITEPRRGWAYVVFRKDDLTDVPGVYRGANRKLGDYYIREIERVGTDRRQVVRYEVVGTGRVETMPRSRFEKQARAV